MMLQGGAGLPSTAEVPLEYPAESGNLLQSESEIWRYKYELYKQRCAIVIQISKLLALICLGKIWITELTNNCNKIISTSH